MIGYLIGKVVQSFEEELILITNSGVGYQMFFSKRVICGDPLEVFVKHIKRENSEDLYGFLSFVEKRVFELLLGVKGIGPKSAFNLVNHVGIKQLLNAILFEDKKTLTSVAGIGPKAGAQILLDLGPKVEKMKAILRETEKNEEEIVESLNCEGKQEKLFGMDCEASLKMSFVDEAIKACEELGFQRAEIMVKTQEVMRNSNVTSSGDLVKLVLREFS